MPKRNVQYYSKILAVKYGISKKDATRVLLRAFKKMASQLKKGNDVRIPGFGHIYFNKEAWSDFLQGCEDTRKKRRLAKRKRLEKEQAERINKINEERERRAK